MRNILILVIFFSAFFYLCLAQTSGDTTRSADASTTASTASTFSGDWNPPQSSTFSSSSFLSTTRASTISTTSGVTWHSTWGGSWNSGTTNIWGGSEDTTSGFVSASTSSSSTVEPTKSTSTSWSSWGETETSTNDASSTVSSIGSSSVTTSTSQAPASQHPTTRTVTSFTPSTTGDIFEEENKLSFTFSPNTPQSAADIKTGGVQANAHTLILDGAPFGLQWQASSTRTLNTRGQNHTEIRNYAANIEDTSASFVWSNTGYNQEETRLYTNKYVNVGGEYGSLVFDFGIQNWEDSDREIEFSFTLTMSRPIKNMVHGQYRANGWYRYDFNATDYIILVQYPEDADYNSQRLDLETDLDWQTGESTINMTYTLDSFTGDVEVMTAVWIVTPDYYEKHYANGQTSDSVKNGDSLSRGAIAGIIIVVLLVGWGLVIVCHRRHLPCPQATQFGELHPTKRQNVKYRNIMNGLIKLWNFFNRTLFNIIAGSTSPMMSASSIHKSSSFLLLATWIPPRAITSLCKTAFSSTSSN